MKRAGIFTGSALTALILGAAAALASANGNQPTYAEIVYSEEADHRGYGSTTKLGTATGAYQFTFETLQDLGYVEKGQKRPPFGADPWDGIRWTGKGDVNSRTEFLANTSAQDQALGDFTERNWTSIQSKVPLNTEVNGVPMTKSGALFATHMLGSGGFRQWESCGFKAHCLDHTQAAANNMTKGQLQAKLMGRLAKGAGVDPSTITDGSGSGAGMGMGGGEVSFEMVQMKLMPWDSPGMRPSMLPGDM